MMGVSPAPDRREIGPALTGAGSVEDVLREVEYFADRPRRILRPHLLFDHTSEVCSDVSRSNRARSAMVRATFKIRSVDQFSISISR